MSDCEEILEDSELMKALLLDVGHERNVDSLLAMLVSRLAAIPEVALARIWLVKPGDLCSSCSFAKECKTNIDCLHLMASGGQSQVDPTEFWNNIDGRYCRFPIGVRKVGMIVETGEPMKVDCVADTKWIANLDWAQAEDLHGFSGQPLLHKGKALGILGVFTRSCLNHSEIHTWLKMIADHVAMAIIHARAFEEIEHLKKQLELENEYLREEVNEAHDFGDIIGQSPALRSMLQQIELVAPTDANVLILGDSGTGKELIAREIHNRSPRAGGPMIKVNCPSIPESLFESEFFGHIKGSFTGAIADRAGRFEAADGGTLFLDEIGEIPLALQGKLLRVIQEGTYERVGEEKTRTVDCRIIAATNRDLKKEAEKGLFRMDLYYRLCVFPIEVVPLKERKEDIGLLTTHFIEKISKCFGITAPRLTQANVIYLQSYDWPGNIRELQNIIERAIIISGSKSLKFDLPLETKESVNINYQEEDFSIKTDKEIKAIERSNILKALEQTDWRIYGNDGAAVLLQMKPTTLSSKIKVLKLKRSK